MQDKIIRQYLFLSVLFSVGGLSIISAMYVTYLMNHGLSLFETNAVNAIYFFTLFICEIPTGAFADIFGRKKSFVVACLLMGASMFIYGSVTTFTGFVISAFVIHEMFRGTFDPLLGSFLHKRIPSSERATIDSFCAMSPHIAGSIGLLASGAIAEMFGIRFAWLVSGLILIIGAIAVRNDHNDKDGFTNS